MMFVIKYKKLFFFFSGILILASGWSLWNYGLKLGIDFTGGSIMEVNYSSERPSADDIRTVVDKLNLGQVSVQLAGDNDVILRLKTLTEDEHQFLLGSLPGSPTEKRFSSIGPTVGQELAERGLIAIALVTVLIILFIAFAFRHVSRPVSSWKYGVVAFIALLHDLIIPVGIFSYLGASRGVEIDALFLTGLLTILGLSVHDTIVVFDRIRENLKKKVSPHFTETVGQSLSETFGRSLNTSLTIIFVLVVLYFFGAVATQNFSLLMAIGVAVGTYSSIFIASPLLVVWERWSNKS
ncbi:protein translocase subunit SecF [Candidatus Nomurabacteria bacterium]|nr:protein translocase subunit SecF [Candidatus Nomurabacteria bacterium]